VKNLNDFLMIFLIIHKISHYKVRISTGGLVFLPQSWVEPAQHKFFASKSSRAGSTRIYFQKFRVEPAELDYFPNFLHSAGSTHFFVKILVQPAEPKLFSIGAFLPINRFRAFSWPFLSGTGF